MDLVESVQVCRGRACRTDCRLSGDTRSQVLKGQQPSSESAVTGETRWENQMSSRSLGTAHDFPCRVRSLQHFHDHSTEKVKKKQLRSQWILPSGRRTPCYRSISTSNTKFHRNIRRSKLNMMNGSGVYPQSVHVYNVYQSTDVWVVFVWSVWLCINCVSSILTPLFVSEKKSISPAFPP